MHLVAVTKKSPRDRGWVPGKIIAGGGQKAGGEEAARVGRA